MSPLYSITHDMPCTHGTLQLPSKTTCAPHTTWGIDIGKNESHTLDETLFPDASWATGMKQATWCNGRITVRLGYLEQVCIRLMLHQGDILDKSECRVVPLYI
jgi:hypothetical protein